jgi:hypothetical protein
MKKIVLDTQRSQIMIAESVSQDGDQYTVICSGQKRIIPALKIAYIEDCEESSETLPLPRKDTPTPPERQTTILPVLGRQQNDMPLSSAFAKAVEDKLRAAPPPDPYDDSTPKYKDHEIIVELAGSASGSYSIATDADSFKSEHVEEALVSDIFSNYPLKDSLKQHNVVGITKSGNLVTLDCRLKPPIQPQSVNSAMTGLVNNIIGLVSPTVKLPDIPTKDM